jgi:eukaryotic-like serine/threonine-protein kinase
MSLQLRLTDDMIRAALTPAPELRAPTGLAESIRGAVEVTPQRRHGFLGWAPSRRTSLILRLVVVGLLLLAALAALLLAGSRPANPPPSVTTYHGGPARNGLMPGPGPVGVPVVQWHTAMRGPMGAASPAVEGDAVYIGDENGFVSALDEATGAIRWQVPVGAPVNGPVTVADGIVLVGDDAGVIHGIDAATATSRWTFKTGGPIHSSATIVGDVAVFGSLDGNLYALDIATGRTAWGPVTTPGPISRSVAASGGLIYAGSGGLTPDLPATLGAYDSATGTLSWSRPLESGNTSTPSVGGGRVFVSGGLDTTSAPGGRLYAFDATTGAPAWPTSFPAPAGSKILIVALSNEAVYAADTKGSLYALDAATGSQLWSAPIGSTLSPSGGLIDDVLYVTSDDQKVHAFDIATRKESWEVSVRGVPGTPAVVDGRILVGTSLGQVESLGSAPGAGGQTAGSGSP